MASRELVRGKLLRRMRSVRRCAGPELFEELVERVRKEFAKPADYMPFRGRNAARRNDAVERGLKLNSVPTLNDTQRAEKVAADTGYSVRHVFTIFGESSAKEPQK
jgi:hypothetical protein